MMLSKVNGKLKHQSFEDIDELNASSLFLHGRFHVFIQYEAIEERMVLEVGRDVKQAHLVVKQRAATKDEGFEERFHEEGIVTQPARGEDVRDL